MPLLIYKYDLLFLVPTGSNYHARKARLGIFYLMIIAIIILLKLICLFALDLVIAGGCNSEGLAYARRDTVNYMQYLQKFLGQNRLLVLHFLPFIYKESIYQYIYILGLTIQQHLGWSSQYHLQCQNGGLMSGQELLLGQAVPR